MSPSASDVTIITVNWNGRHHLESLLPSLLEQEAREIIVVDNGSVDDSVEFLESNYPEIRILKNPVNRGFCQPNNLAAKAARGKILAFINNDMRADREWVIKGIRKLESCDCVSSRILSWDGNHVDFNGSSLQYLGYALQKDTGKLLAQVSGNGGEILFPCGGAMFIDREVFLESGGFDEDFFAIYEDVDLGWRLWISGHRVELDPDSIVYHRGHATFATQENSRMRYLMHRNALMTIIKNYSEDNLKRIFPMALLMAVARAVRCSGVRKESFYLWEDAAQGLTAGDKGIQSSSLDSLNHLVAVEDAIQMLPALLEKRQMIQARRRVEDQEILRLFKDPLRPIVEDRGYISTESELLEMLGLDALFDLGEYRKKADGCGSISDTAKERARKELRALEWMGGYALRQPPDRVVEPGPGIRKFIRVARSRGLTVALGEAWKSIRRGFRGRD
jgi:GT2 family glycosyltransferase